MKANWSKSESRDVRPFFDVESLAPALSKAAIRLFDTMAFTADRAFVLNEQDARRLDVTLRPGLDQALVRACRALKPNQLSLAIIATNPFLKRTRVVERHSLADAIPTEVSIGPEVIEALGGPNNLEIGICLCLTSALPKTAGRPFFPGHWLARASFTLRSARIAEDFDIEPLDDEGWKIRNLPAKTLYYVDYIGPINEPPQPDQQVAKVYLHADVYRRLAAERDPASVRSVQAMLATEIVCQILLASVVEWEGSAAPEPRSVLAAVLKRINKDYACDLPQLRLLVQEQGLQKLRAVLQSDQEVVRAIVEGQ